eukprot:5909896-Amphidinium_carterae.1
MHAWVHLANPETTLSSNEQQNRCSNTRRTRMRCTSCCTEGFVRNKAGSVMLNMAPMNTQRVVGHAYKL